LLKALPLIAIAALLERFKNQNATQTIHPQPTALGKASRQQLPQNCLDHKLVCCEMQTGTQWFGAVAWERFASVG